MTRIKICGCTEPEHALAAAESGADFVGLVFAESRRKVTVEKARSIIEALELPGRPERESRKIKDLFEGASALDELLSQGRPLTVGVFANNPFEEVESIVRATGIDLVQFSGTEPWDFCSRVSVPTLKVVHVSTDDTLPSIFARLEADSGALGVLLDKGSASAFGGTGQTLDWSLAAQVQAQVPVWLAGGLTPENVFEAISTVKPWAVDVSSGVEVNGIKDVGRIKEFISAARLRSF